VGARAHTHTPNITSMIVSYQPGLHVAHTTKDLDQMPEAWWHGRTRSGLADEIVPGSHKKAWHFRKFANHFVSVWCEAFGAGEVCRNPTFAEQWKPVHGTHEVRLEMVHVVRERAKGKVVRHPRPIFECHFGPLLKEPNKHLHRAPAIGLTRG
jgi:hypothetical protein